MPTELPPMRRIVTGTGPDGRSRIVEDGPPPVISTIAARPGLRNANIWSTSATPAPVDAPDRIAEHKGLYPPKNGTVIRIMDIPSEPQDPERLKAWFGASSQTIFPDRERRVPDKSRHPGMHITDTVDYAIILFGEMYAVMEDGETLMKAGDVLVQRGTNHAWSNRSGEVCRVAFILVDGQRD
jgi:hypothetical protein